MINMQKQLQFLKDLGILPKKIEYDGRSWIYKGMTQHGIIYDEPYNRYCIRETHWYTLEVANNVNRLTASAQRVIAEGIVKTILSMYIQKGYENSFWKLLNVNKDSFRILNI